MFIRNLITMEDIGDQKVLCKAIVIFDTYSLGLPATRGKLQMLLIKSIKLKKPTPGKSREYISDPISPSQASRMIDLMIERGYLYVHSLYKQSPGQRLIRATPGEKMYKVDDLHLTQCMETEWYKNRMRKQKLVIKEKGIDARSCNALVQLFTLFKTTPFSYNTATMVGVGVTTILSNGQNLTPAEKMSYKSIKQNLYGSDTNSFREVWQKLIRNGFIVRHKIKTTDGYIKYTDLYRINPAYLKHCLAQMM